MEKVKLTQEQADTIERLKKHHRYEIERFKRNPNHFADWLLPIKDIDIEHIEHACREGYEVEPEFKEGNWVTHEDGIVSKVTSIDERDIITTDYRLNNGGSKYMNTFAKYFRHATPKEVAKEQERRWWEKHGRDPWEMKRGDLILHDGDLLFVNKTDFDDYFALEASNYHLNTRLSEYHVRQCKVICFAEDRKDVDQ